ncbi:MAG: Manganese transport system membrane protein MntB [Chroococcidiopsis cubana SAG 39.79]|jgi:manganese/iron transport system permease protein|uniref:ABC-3 protein n=2 Tax=Chroococcidiopsis TaxID=54298 RepID=K9TWB2_CHRTP|nr:MULTISPECIES: metal ABC transporter permease [Chroococcidiopsis]PSB49288.1 metal ABC transporter permease [Cyanosarcina cf. burmensis CCALA 770]AFY86845.1 ABC-3 protein [Chroococcidiopsis thermalis PCC 7203]MDZ4874131.1 Manganese transport system membrane protein MntB [Chroococcidiopsis cubana SAG 39.79]PSB60111.1 metal ABC transporter permease [Chroococcidiopsis cubana CCALA 043]RUT12283.1 ABC transporter permease [Chroococcidiopsis cubana SAG 39.79]
MTNLLLEPLSFEFMRLALVTAILLGILCSVIGTYLIVQRMGLLGDVIAHAVLPGLAIAFFLGIDIFVGAFISGTLSTFVISWIQSQSRIKVDVAMALVFSGFLALGITLITVLKSKLDLHQFLFGDLLGVTTIDVWKTFAIAIIILLLVKLFYKELLFYTFDPLGAQAVGLPVTLIHLGLTSAITLTIIASMQAVGIVLVVSLLIGPGATAYLLVKELHQMMIFGSIIGIFSSVTGMYFSYYFNVPSGAAIVLVVSGLFILALLFSPSQGILTQPAVANRSLSILGQFKQSNKRI